ncbi:MAG: hypothetical protein AAFN94_16995 [Pseudomonadota bacterium]
MFKKLGLQHPFFLSPLRRGLTVLAIAVWGGLETWAGNVGWSIFALLLGAVTALEFFVLFKPENYGGDDA